MSIIPPKGSIPGSVRNNGNGRAAIGRVASKPGFRVENYQNKPKTHYSNMKTGALDKMLADAILLHDQVQELIKVDPSNENLDRFGKLAELVNQLRLQIAGRKI